MATHTVTVTSLVGSLTYSSRLAARFGLGRLVLDQNFKDRAGMEEQNGSLVFHFAATDLEDFFERVIGDFAADVGVSEIRSKPLRAEYLESTPEPDPKQRKPQDAQLTSAPAPKPKPATKKSKSAPKPPSKPPKPFKDLDLSRLDPKTQTLLREFRTLKVEKTPHAAAVLIRCILELSADGYIADAVTLGNIAANMEPFLQALNDDV